MKPKEYKADLASAGLSQEGFADLIGIGRRTSQGYAIGEYPVHPAVAILLRLVAKGTLQISDIEGVRK